MPKIPKKDRQYVVIVFPPPNAPRPLVAMEFYRNDHKKLPYATRAAADRKASSLRVKYPRSKGWRVRVGWWELKHYR